MLYSVNSPYYRQFLSQGGKARAKKAEAAAQVPKAVETKTADKPAASET